MHDVTLATEKGKLTALIGPNGAGKTTLLKSIVRLVKVSSGRVFMDNNEITRLSTRDIIRMGISYVPQGADVFSKMTVIENLKMGGYLKKDRTALDHQINEIFEIFPILKERRKQKAGFLSGGERQMLAIGRGLVGSPRLLLLDEPSIGLDVGKQSVIFEKLKELKQSGLTILLVEQNASLAAQVADEAYILSGGIIKYHGDVTVLTDPKFLSTVYFG